MIEFVKYTEDELRPYFDKEFEERILPPVYQGKKYILDNLGKLYSLTLRKEEVMRKLQSWSIPASIAFDPQKAMLAGT